jgi:myo-inositol 2-dehydrogenase/D-chiro-inositol 1-dehydrogenase
VLNVCLFGAGRIGRIHAANLAAHPGVRLLFVVDVNAAAAQQLADQHGAKVATIDQALADERLSAVVIATSTDTHHELIDRCVARGLPMLCEKPLDLDLKLARASLARAGSAGVPLFVGFNRRFDPSFRRIRDEAHAGGLGAIEVISITSRDPQPPPVDYVRRSGGLFRDMMIHDLDMALWLLGEMPDSVYATGSCLADPAIGEAGDIDTATVVLRTRGGALCQITNSRRCSYGYDQRLEVFCAGGMLQAGNQTATQVRRADAGGFLSEPALPFFLERYEMAYRLQIETFVAAIDQQAEGPASAAEALQSLLLAEAAERSLASGRAERPAS